MFLYHEHSSQLTDLAVCQRVGVLVRADRAGESTVRIAMDSGPDRRYPITLDPTSRNSG